MELHARSFPEIFSTRQRRFHATHRIQVAPMLQGRGSLVQTRHNARKRRCRAPPVFPPSVKEMLMLDSLVPIRATFDLGSPPGDVPEVTAAAADAKPREVRFCVAIDFDGCLARKAWPAVGEEMPGSMAFLKWIGEQEWWIVLWTCRSAKKLDDALDWLAERGFGSAWWTAINATPQPITAQYGHDSRKIGAHIFLDDLAVGFPVTKDGIPDWDRIKAELEERATAWRA
jgi:hypothetical protein